MITDKNYKDLAEDVYELDPLKKPNFDEQVKINDEIESAGQTFIVLDVVGNSASPYC